MASKFLKNFKKMSLKKKIISMITALIFILIIYGIGKRIKRKIDIRRFDNNQDKENVQIAMQYIAAVNPSGISWMIGFDGTNETAIKNLAYRTKGRLQAVADVYRTKFNESLSDRMRWELSAQEYQDWTNIVD